MKKEEKKNFIVKVDGKVYKYNYITLQTKVTPKAAEKFKRAAKRGGFTSYYELMQLLVQKFIEFTDNGQEVNEQNEEDQSLMLWSEMFSQLVNSTARINTVKPRSTEELVFHDSVVIMKSASKRGKYTAQAIINSKDGEKRITTNVDKMIDTMLKRLMPDMWRELYAVAASCGTESVVDVIKILVKESTIPRMREDADAVLGITQNEYGIVPVNHYNKQKKE